MITLSRSFGLQIAAACGANVIATSSSDEKLEVAKKLGATHTINYKNTPEWEKEVLRIVRDHWPCAQSKCAYSFRPDRRARRRPRH